LDFQFPADEAVEEREQLSLRFSELKTARVLGDKGWLSAANLAGSLCSQSQYINARRDQD